MMRLNAALAAMLSQRRRFSQRHVQPHPALASRAISRDNHIASPRIASMQK
jgi:hypothetical protein